MFFRRHKDETATFAERLVGLRAAGFVAAPLASGKVQVSRGGFAAVLDGRSRGGPLIGGEIAALVDAGFQKFFETPSGRRRPTGAAELSALHAFEQDLKEALGLPSLYNESLGTVSARCRYDRLAGR